MIKAEVKVIPTYSKTNLIAIAAIVFEDIGIKVTGLKVIRGKNGLFVQFPTKEVVDKRTGEKDYPAIVFPITNQAREEISNLIISAYRDTVKGMLESLGETA